MSKPTTMSSPTMRQTGGRRKSLVEELLSLRTNSGVTLHAYIVVLPNARLQQTEQIRNLLCALAEQNQWPYLPMLLETRLSSGGDVVRQILNRDAKTASSIKRTLDGIEDLHISVFALPTNCAADQQLMELH